MSKLWWLTYNFFYPESSSNVGTIVGSVVGTLAFIAVAAAVIIVGVCIVKCTKMGKQELMYTVQLLRCTAICWTSTGQNRNFINVLNELCQSSSCQYRNRDKTSTYTHIWYECINLCVCALVFKRICVQEGIFTLAPAKQMTPSWAESDHTQTQIQKQSSTLGGRAQELHNL